VWILAGLDIKIRSCVTDDPTVITEAFLTVHLRTRLHAPRVPNFKETAACRRRTTALDGVPTSSHHEKKKSIYSHLQRFKTRHDFKAFLCYDVRLLISCCYCIIQFGLKKNIRKERGRLTEHVIERKKYKNKHKQHQQEQKQKQTKTIIFLDVITFQFVLYYAFGEINLYNLVWRPKNQTFANDCKSMGQLTDKSFILSIYFDLFSQLD